MKHFAFLAFLTLGILSKTLGQIELTITKIDKDSFNIALPKDTTLEMGKKYQFILNTNISDKDNLYENLSNSKIYNGGIIEKTFNYHEFGFTVYKLNKKKEQSTICSKRFDIKGTKYIVKIDNRIITRYEPNRIGPNSKIEIELVSETSNRELLKVTDPIILYWMGNQTSNLQIQLSKYVASIDLTNETAFKERKTSNEFNYVVLLLPQVFEGENKVLPDTQKERMYMISYKD